MERVAVKQPEMDLPPEYCHYHDEGCELASSCLNCPFPRCIYEQPRGRQRWLKRARDLVIARRFSTGNKEVKELALEFRVSQRTIQRALKKTWVTEVYLYVTCPPGTIPDIIS